MTDPGDEEASEREGVRENIFDAGVLKIFLFGERSLECGQRNGDDVESEDERGEDGPRAEVGVRDEFVSDAGVSEDDDAGTKAERDDVKLDSKVVWGVEGPRAEGELLVKSAWIFEGVKYRPSISRASVELGSTVEVGVVGEDDPKAVGEVLDHSALSDRRFEGEDIGVKVARDDVELDSRVEVGVVGEVVSREGRQVWLDDRARDDHLLEEEEEDIGVKVA